MKKSLNEIDLANQSNIAKMQQRFLDEKDERKRKEIIKRIELMQKKEKKKLRDTITTTAALMINKKIKIVNVIISILVIGNIGISLFENSIFIDPKYAKDIEGNIIIENDVMKIIKPEYTADSLVDSMKWLNLAIVCTMELFVILRYLLDLKYLQKINKAGKYDSLITTGLWKGLILEFAILAIIAPPHTTKILKGLMLFGRFTYASDSIILVFVFLKLYYLSKMYSDFSLWATKPIQIIAKQFNIKIGFSFAFKAQIKQYPLVTIFFILIICLIILSIMLRVFEYGYSDDEVIPGSKGITNTRFKSYQDTFWLIIVSMLTIGYGELYPNTHFGRVIVFLGSVIGMLIISLLIVTLSYMIDFTREEQKAYNMIVSKNVNRMKKVKATMLLSALLQLSKAKKYGHSHKYKTRYK
jgi:hypothetical protein